MKSFNEDEVSGEMHRQTNIAKIEQDIAIGVSQLDEDMSMDNINALMSLYQKAIEYFSADSDDRFMGISLNAIPLDWLSFNCLQRLHGESTRTPQTIGHSDYHLKRLG